MLIRPAEPEDLPSVRRFLDFEEAPDDVVAAGIVAAEEQSHRVVGEVGGEVVAYAKLAAGHRARFRHGATVSASGTTTEHAATLLAWLLAHNRRWVGHPRVTVSLPASHALTERLPGLGLTQWVRRAGGWRVNDVTDDHLLWGWLRADLVPTEAPRVGFPRPARREERLVELRPSVPDDAPALAALLRSESVMWGTLQAGTSSAATWRARLGDPQRGVAATVEGELVGHAGVFPAGGGGRAHCLTLGIAILPGFQGLGIGEKLMRSVLAQARERGAARVELQVWADNDRAIALYEKLGFVREGFGPCMAWRDGGWAHDLFMALPLAA